MFTVHIEGPVVDEKSVRAIRRAFAKAIDEIRLALPRERRHEMTGGASGHVEGDSFSVTLSELRSQEGWKD